MTDHGREIATLLARVQNLRGELEAEGRRLASARETAEAWRARATAAEAEIERRRGMAPPPG